MRDGLQTVLYPTLGIEDICGELRLFVSQYVSLTRFLPRSIVASLTVVYSAGTGVVPTGNLKQIGDRLSTIAMQVDAVVAFALIWQ